MENSFTEAAKKQAENVYKTVTDLPTVLLYYEFMDFLEINKLLAEKFQERSGLLLDHYTLIQRSIQDYRNLAVSPGKSLSNFLSGCVCPEVCTIPDCTLADIEKCSNPLCDDNISLQKYFDPNFKLSEARVIMYQNLLQSLSNYFSLDLVNALVVFDNREFFTETDPRTKMNNFKFVCNFFDIEESKCNQIGLSYFSLVEQLQQDPTYSRNFKSQPSLFWPMVLQNNGDTLQISTELRDFMMILMVLSDSSAEAERGMNTIGYQLYCYSLFIFTKFHI